MVTTSLLTLILWLTTALKGSRGLTTILRLQTHSLNGYDDDDYCTICKVNKQTKKSKEYTLYIINILCTRNSEMYMSCKDYKQHLSTGRIFLNAKILSVATFDQSNDIFLEHSNSKSKPSPQACRVHDNHADENMRSLEFHSQSTEST